MARWKAEVSRAVQALVQIPAQAQVVQAHQAQVHALVLASSSSSTSDEEQVREMFRIRDDLEKAKTRLAAKKEETNGWEKTARMFWEQKKEVYDVLPNTIDGKMNEPELVANDGTSVEKLEENADVAYNNALVSNIEATTLEEGIARLEKMLALAK